MQWNKFDENTPKDKILLGAWLNTFNVNNETKKTACYNTFSFNEATSKFGYATQSDAKFSNPDIWAYIETPSVDWLD